MRILQLDEKHPSGNQPPPMAVNIDAVAWTARPGYDSSHDQTQLSIVGVGSFIVDCPYQEFIATIAGMRGIRSFRAEFGR